MEGKLEFNQRLYNQLHDVVSFVSPELQLRMERGNLTPKDVVDIAKSIKIIEKGDRSIRIIRNRIQRSAYKKPEDQQNLQQRIDLVNDICKRRHDYQPQAVDLPKKQEHMPQGKSEVPVAPPPPPFQAVKIKRKAVKEPEEQPQSKLHSPPPAPPIPPLAPAAPPLPKGVKREAQYAADGERAAKEQKLHGTSIAPSMPPLAPSAPSIPVAPPPALSIPKPPASGATAHKQPFASVSRQQPVVTKKDLENIEAFFKKYEQDIGEHELEEIELGKFDQLQAQTPEEILGDLQEIISGMDKEVTPADFAKNLIYRLRLLAVSMSEVEPDTQTELNAIEDVIKEYEMENDNINTFNMSRTIEPILNERFFLDMVPERYLNQEVRNGLSMLLEAFKMDYANLEKTGKSQFIDVESASVDSDKVMEFLRQYKLSDKIGERVVSALNVYLTDNMVALIENAKGDPDSRYNQIQIRSYMSVFSKLEKALEKLPEGSEYRDQCRIFLDSIKQSFAETKVNLGEQDHREEAFKQIERNYNYKIVDREKPFALGGDAWPYKISRQEKVKKPDGKTVTEEVPYVLKVLKEPIRPEVWKQYNPTGELISKKIIDKHVLSPNEILLNAKGEIIALVLPYMDGKDLTFISKLKVPLDQEIARSYLTQIAKGLSAIHKANFVHLDFHFGNILKDMKGNVKVMDFGKSLILNDDGLAHGIPGLTEFAPPEKRAGDLTQKYDVYSFGKMMFRMLEGKFPTIRYEKLTNEEYAAGKIASIKEIDFDNIKDPSIQELIKASLETDSNKRPSIEDFLRHPYFSEA